jgi:RNA polymerase sigma-70 factor (ECF subfamily)
MVKTEKEQPRAPTDAELVARCLHGDSDAFTTLTHRYYRPVAAVIYKRVQQFHLVEDLVQETFLEAYRSLKAGRRPEQFSSWLFAIAHHCCGKWLRRKRPRLFAPDDPPTTLEAPPQAIALEEIEEQQKLLATLDEGLAALPEETRRLLELKHRQGKTCEEIATAWGRPVGTIKSLLSRTYKLLRARLRPGGGPTS